LGFDCCCSFCFSSSAASLLRSSSASRFAFSSSADDMVGLGFMYVLVSGLEAMIVLFLFFRKLSYSSGVIFNFLKISCSTIYAISFSLSI